MARIPERKRYLRVPAQDEREAPGVREGDEKIVRCQLFPTVQAAMDVARTLTSATPNA
jgi:hypothetical protein